VCVQCTVNGLLKISPRICASLPPTSLQHYHDHPALATSLPRVARSLEGDSIIFLNSFSFYLFIYLFIYFRFFTYVYFFTWARVRYKRLFIEGTESSNILSRNQRQCEITNEMNSCYQRKQCRLTLKLLRSDVRSNTLA
jgi:hypothetical protein